MNQKCTRKGFTVIEIVIVIGILALLAGVYYVNQKGKTTTTTTGTSVTTTPDTTTTTETTTTTTESKDETSDWKTYKNDKYKFQITLDDKWSGYTVSEEDESENGAVWSSTFNLPTKDAEYIKRS